MTKEGKAIFIHDHPFIKGTNNQIYSQGSFSRDVWKRYLNHFSEVHIISRSGDSTSNTAHLTPVSNKNVTFTLLNIDSNIKLLIPSLRRKITKEITFILRSSDAAIIRLPSQLGILANSIAKKNNIPVVIEVAGDVWNAFYHHGSFLGKLYAPVATFKVKKAIRNSSHVIYVTQYFLQKSYPTKGKSIGISNVSISDTDISTLKKRLESITSVQKTNRKIIIGMIGSPWIMYKGAHVAIEAIRVLITQGIDCELRILGGNDKNDTNTFLTKNNCEKFVKIDQKIPSGDPVHQWLDNIDFYIQPSYQEGLPRALIEAMSRGCPALGSTTAGIPELLPPQYIHKPGDYRKLANDIKKLLDDKYLMINEINKNYHYSQCFTESINMKRRDFFFKQFKNDNGL